MQDHRRRRQRRPTDREVKTYAMKRDLWRWTIGVGLYNLIGWTVLFALPNTGERRQGIEIFGLALYVGLIAAFVIGCLWIYVNLREMDEDL